MSGALTNNGELSPVVMDALCKQLVTDISSTLVNKEEALWKRGQAELKKLQQEHQLQLSAVQGRLQEVESRQKALLTENVKMKEALMDVTSKFEFAVTEMREALRWMPRRTGVQAASPSPSIVSTAASDCQNDRASASPGITDTSTMMNSSERPSSLLRDHAEDTGDAEQETSKDGEIPALQQLWTPPRGTGGDASTGIGMSSTRPSATPGTTVLSLATVLPDANVNTPSKPLHLAEHLEGQHVVPSTNSAVPGASPNMNPSNVATPGSTATLGSSQNSVELLRVELVKEPNCGALGIEVHQADDASLRIDDIDEDGLVGRYNARQGANSTSAVILGDRIVDVNGVSGDPSKMLEECKVKQRLMMTLARSSNLESITSPQAVQDAVDGQVAGTGPQSGSPLRSSGLRAEASIFVPNFDTQPTMHRQGAPPGLEPPALDAAALLTTVSTPTVPPYIPAPPPNLPPNSALMDMALLMAGRGLPNTDSIGNRGYPQQQKDSSSLDHEQVKRALFS